MIRSADHTLLHKIAESIEVHRILPSRRVLVALSGGADSVALLRILLALGYECEAAHCNFQLRGEESERDEMFVRQLCGQQGVALHTTTFSTRDYASEHGISIEMAARDLRYDYFNQLLQRRGIDRVAVAHHQGDNVETMLLNMVRGTGLRGLTGMAYVNGNVVRPLLDVSREEIQDYLQSIGQDYVTDSSNNVADVKRNLVRLKLLPLLRKLNPSVEQTLINNAHHLREAYEYILATSPCGALKEQPGGASCCIPKREIDSHLSLFLLLSDKGFTPSQTFDIWEQKDQEPGAIYHSATHSLLRDRNCFILRRKGGKEIPVVPQPAHDVLDITYVPVEQFATLPRCKEVALLDADLVGEGLEVRLWEKGDRFVPLGMTGTKLVSDFLTDLKVNAFDKQQQRVLTNGRDILWVVGQRIDNRYKVVEGTTQRIMVCKLPEQEFRTKN